MTPHATKPFYSSQVHPTYLPTLHKSGRVEKKLALGIIAAAGIGYGLQKYKEARIEELDRQSTLSSRSPAAQSPPLSAEEHRRRQSQEALMDAYGDRSSLDSLEAAIQAYNSAQKSDDARK